MINKLKQIEHEMSEKPSVDSMTEMIRLIELTMKQHVGENVVGLKASVGQIMKAIQNKASKDEVMRLVARHINNMQGSGTGNGTLVNDSSPAGAVKCISCGSHYKPGLYHQYHGPRPTVYYSGNYSNNRPRTAPISIRNKSPNQNSNGNGFNSQSRPSSSNGRAVKSDQYVYSPRSTYPAQSQYSKSPY